MNVESARFIKRKIKRWASRTNGFKGVVISSVFINLLSLMLPIFLLQVYDRIIPNKAYESLSLLLLIAMIAIFIEGLLQYGRYYIACWSDTVEDHKQGSKAFDQLLNANIQEFEDVGAGRQLERLSNLRRLKDFYGEQALTTIIDIPFFILFLVIIALIGGWIVMVPLVILTLFAISMILLNSYQQDALQNRSDADDKRISFIIEVLHGMHIIKSMAMESAMVRRYERLQKQSIGTEHQLSVYTAHSSSTVNFLTQMNMVLIVSIGSTMVMSNELTIGGLAAVTLLGNRCLHPLSKMISTWRRLQTVMIADKKLNKIFQTEQESTTDYFPEDFFKQTIEFRNVSFKYSDNGKYILKNINLTIHKNDAIWISCNGNGGKSTLMNLLYGIIKPTEGDILIDGVPHEQYNTADLRRNIAYLQQYGTIYKGTILENITMFETIAKYKKALEISIELGLDQAVYKLRKGFDTEVGIGVTNYLPNGLRQRIAIARELIDSPPIILFDEANTAIDIDSDEQLKIVLKNQKINKTIIIITNRPSIASLANRKILIINGELEEQTDEIVGSKCKRA